MIDCETPGGCMQANGQAEYANQTCSELWCQTPLCDVHAIEVWGFPYCELHAEAARRRCAQILAITDETGMLVGEAA